MRSWLRRFGLASWQAGAVAVLLVLFALVQWVSPLGDASARGEMARTAQQGAQAGTPAAGSSDALPDKASARPPASAAAGQAAATPAAKPGSIPEVRLSALPFEARTTLALIKAGGPFPYDRDGIVFNNREKLLPLQGRGWYREYTVKTPGVRTRGARRIVAARSGEFYYTDDHYSSFRRIRE